MHTTLTDMDCARSVLSCLRSAGADGVDIVKETGQDRQLVRRTLERLESYGLVAPTPDGRWVIPATKGRPRSLATIERDERILGALTDGGPMTRNQLSELLDIPPVLTWLALDRLRKAHHVRTCLTPPEEGASPRRGRDTVWTAAASAPCP
jgi:DNA-binding IclR family transcriptional regulator